MSQRATLPEVATLAAQLPPPERKQLAETILRELAAESSREGAPRRRAWREIRSSVSSPCLAKMPRPGSVAAAALAAGCQAFLTNDRALQRVRELSILVLDDLSP